MANTPFDWVAWLSPGVLILVGAVLFFVPLPPTTLIGIALIVVGAALWIVDYLGRDDEMEEDRPRGRRRTGRTGGD